MNGFAGQWRLSFVGGKGKLFPRMKREWWWTTQKVREDYFEDQSQLLKEIGMKVHQMTEKWWVEQAMKYCDMLNETESWANGRRKRATGTIFSAQLWTSTTGQV